MSTLRYFATGRIDWIGTMHATVEPEDCREFMVRLLSMIEIDIDDAQFERAIQRVLKHMPNQKTAIAQDAKR